MIRKSDRRNRFSYAKFVAGFNPIVHGGGEGGSRCDISTIYGQEESFKMTLKYKTLAFWGSKVAYINLMDLKYHEIFYF